MVTQWHLSAILLRFAPPNSEKRPRFGEAGQFFADPESIGPFSPNGMRGDRGAGRWPDQSPA